MQKEIQCPNCDYGALEKIKIGKDFYMACDECDYCEAE